jgi:2-iminobutanoate/2-iminopropanoate deaminase
MNDIRRINPATLYDGASVGLSQAVVDPRSGLVFVSGQVDWDHGLQVQHADVAAQAESAVQNLLTALAAAGSSAGQVLQLRVYVRGEVADHIGALAPVLVRHFGAVRPALTGIGVASLASPQTLVEIEAVARVAA